MENPSESHQQKRERALEIGSNALQVILDWKYSSDKWKIEKGVDSIEGCVKSKKFGRNNQIFLLQARLNIEPSILFQDLAKNIDEQTKWNSLVSKFQILETLSDGLDVLYYTIPGKLCGFLQGRDFILFRYYKKMNESYVHAVCGTTHPEMPEQRGIVRGGNGPGGWILEPVPNFPNQCDFFWFSNSDIKLPIPNFIFKTALCCVMMEFLDLLRKRVEILQEKSSTTKTVIEQQTQEIKHKP